MILTDEEENMLAGGQGKAVQKAMQILVALGKIYGASCMVPVSSVQIAGVSYDNVGEAGLEWLSEMEENGGKARVLATLNPAGMPRARQFSLSIPAGLRVASTRAFPPFSAISESHSRPASPRLS